MTAVSFVPILGDSVAHFHTFHEERFEDGLDEPQSNTNLIIALNFVRQPRARAVVRVKTNKDLANLAAGGVYSTSRRGTALLRLIPCRCTPLLRHRNTGPHQQIQSRVRRPAPCALPFLRWNAHHRHRHHR